jgi:hypothetical protein
MMKNMTVPESAIGSSATPPKTFLAKSGFALGPAGSFFKSARPLKIEIEGLRLLGPARIEDLMQSRTSLEEVKMLIEEEVDPSYIYWGKIRIENEYYSLVDLDYRCQNSETILKANLADDLADLREGDEGLPEPDSRDEFIGHIEMREGGGDSDGSLVISQGIHSGRYSVHLDAGYGG